MKIPKRVVFEIGNRITVVKIKGTITLPSFITRKGLHISNTRVNRVYLKCHGLSITNESEVANALCYAEDLEVTTCRVDPHRLYELNKPEISHPVLSRQRKGELNENT